MEPTPGQIIVANETMASGIAYSIFGGGTASLYSGDLGPQSQTEPLNVSGYVDYTVGFQPVGLASGQQTTVANANVTVVAYAPTKVAMAITVDNPE